MIESTLERLSRRENLSLSEMSQVIELVMQGQCSETEIALLLSALHEKGETVAEVAGAAAALRRQMTPIRSRHRTLLDTCGTGGDGSRTFNISTAAALVTAAAGVPVAKHGNRGITSRTGSADALAALGVNVEADVARVEACLDQLGICFCFAPLLHQSMWHVNTVRKQLGVPTIFNLLGPLSNPAAAPLQLLGVGREALRPLLAEALLLLGTERALVVRGDDGLDELTLRGPTQVTEVHQGSMREFTWTPRDFGVESARLDALIVDGPQESANLIRQVLAGQTGPPRDIVVMNAAAALWIARPGASTRQCAAQAAQAIDSGAAEQLLNRLIELSNS